jgi:hypothetical protein
MRCAVLIPFFAACDDDPLDDRGRGGNSPNGGTGGLGGNAFGGEGGAGSTTQTGGGGGGGEASCVELEVSNFRLTATSLFESVHVGTTNPLAGRLPDLFRLERFDSSPPGATDLGVGDETSFATCTTCLLVFQDHAEEGGAQKLFFQASGTVDYGDSAFPFSSGVVSDVTLVEVTIGAGYVSTVVPGGDCLHLDHFEFTIEPPPDGWACPPEEYGDGVCHCEYCGVHDVDCDDPENPSSCEPGQTCDDVTCVGVPNAWTCAPEDYDGGPGNGCHCLCGTIDPDCSLPGPELVAGCPAETDRCFLGLRCIPKAWTCPDGFYDFLNDCDCGCGVVDPDCADESSASCIHCNSPGSCSAVTCSDPTSPIDPANNAVCQAF